MSKLKAGWYPNPDGSPSERRWNGTEWTSETRVYSPPSNQKARKGLSVNKADATMRTNALGKKVRPEIVAALGAAIVVSVALLAPSFSAETVKNDSALSPQTSATVESEKPTPSSSESSESSEATNPSNSAVVIPPPTQTTSPSNSTPTQTSAPSSNSGAGDVNRHLEYIELALHFVNTNTNSRELLIGDMGALGISRSEAVRAVDEMNQTYFMGNVWRQEAVEYVSYVRGLYPVGHPDYVSDERIRNMMLAVLFLNDDISYALFQP